MGRFAAPHILNPPTLILEGDTQGEGDGAKTVACSLIPCGADIFNLTNQGFPEATTKEKRTYERQTNFFILQRDFHLPSLKSLLTRPGVVEWVLDGDCAPDVGVRD